MSALCIVLIGSVGGIAASDSCTPVAGPVVIDQPGCYAINESVTDSSANVYIEIRSSDVVLEGSDNAIDGSGTDGSIGVFVNGSAENRLQNVTVRDVTVSDWDVGIRYEHADAGAIQAVSTTASQNFDEGIVLRNVTDVTVSDGRTEDHSDQGISVVDSASITIANSSSVDDGTGVKVSGSQGVTVGVGSFVYSNTGASTAVSIVDSGGTVVDSNTVVDGSIASVLRSAGAPNRITNNSASRSSRYGGWTTECGGMSIGNGAEDDLIADNTMSDCSSGTLIQNAERIEFRNNTVTGTDGDGGNSDYGVFVNGGSDNLLVDNRIEDNGRSYTKRPGIRLATERATLSGNTLAGNGFNVRVHASDWATAAHSIDATNTVEGRPVAYHVNETDVTVDPNAGWVGLVGTENAAVDGVSFPANNYENVFLWAADDTVVRNVDSSTGWLGMRIMDGSDRTRVENSTFDGGHGLDLHESTHTHVVDTAITNSNNYGANLYQSPDATFENVTLTGHDKYAIRVQSGSERLTVVDSAIEENGRGIWLERASRSVVVDNVIRNNDGIGVGTQRYVHNTTITGNVLSGNDGDGVTFSLYPEDNLVANNTIADNAGNGIKLGNNGDNDTVRGNVLEGNDAGIYVPRSYEGLTAFDNRFNNSANVVFNDPDGAENVSWNATATAGPNVVGGNYWATPDGTGYSETCVDADDDGFCDDPYALAGNHTDFLPLAAATGGSAAAFEYTDLEVAPQAVAVDESVTATATVTNVGNADGNYTAELFVDGTLEDSASGSLAPDANETVSFDLSFEQPGTYAVAIDELSAETVVVEADDGDSGDDDTGDDGGSGTSGDTGTDTPDDTDDATDDDAEDDTETDADNETIDDPADDDSDADSDDSETPDEDSETDAQADDGGSTTESPEEDSESVPGFGGTAAIGALLTAGAFVRGRRLVGRDD